MTEAITKYTSVPRDGGADAYAEMEEDEYGDWVSLEDHQARIAELEAKLSTAMKALRFMDETILGR